MRRAAVGLVILAALTGCENRLPPDGLDKNVAKADTVSPAAFVGLDASVVLPALFDGDFCRLSVRPHREGCLVNFWAPPADAGTAVVHAWDLPRDTWRGEVVACDSIFWVFERPYRCPCPFVTRDIDVVAPPGQSWFPKPLN